MPTLIIWKHKSLTLSNFSPQPASITDNLGVAIPDLEDGKRLKKKEGPHSHMQIVAWIAFALAAVFEVGGDAVIRMGIKNNNLVVMIFGALSLAAYGLIVNTLDWNFSMILGVYVAVFALTGVLFGRFVFRESIPVTTWLGLGFIMVGGLIIQCGTTR